MRCGKERERESEKNAFLGHCLRACSKALAIFANDKHVFRTIFKIENCAFVFWDENVAIEKLHKMIESRVGCGKKRTTWQKIPIEFLVKKKAVEKTMAKGRRQKYAWIIVVQIKCFVIIISVRFIFSVPRIVYYACNFYKTCIRMQAHSFASEEMFLKNCCCLFESNWISMYSIPNWTIFILFISFSYRLLSISLPCCMAFRPKKKNGFLSKYTWEENIDGILPHCVAFPLWARELSICLSGY